VQSARDLISSVRLCETWGPLNDYEQSCFVMEVRMARFFIIPVVAFLCHTSAFAETLTLAAGAGYKRPVTEIIQAYETSGGSKIDQIYGNMGQITMQARASGTIAFIVGEEGFLRSSGLEFSAFHHIGRGVLVIAYVKGLRLREPEDLLKPKVARVALPDEKHAIYGKAAKEFLHKTGLFNKLEKKLFVVSTVPQVSAYLISGEVEAGFINLTDALYIKDKIGGYLTPDRAAYSPIKLVLGVMKGYEGKASSNRFVRFLETDPHVKQILRKAGLERCEPK
jgi:molybdate transport system substrate-binding protein